MTPTGMIEERGGVPSTYIHASNWREFAGQTYECRVLLCPETDGGYSAIALRLPGVASQGDSVEDALKNISEAFAAAIAVYLEDVGQIPWADVEVERTKGCEERWILVNVQ